MSAEGQLNGPNSYNPEAIQPVEQITLRHIMVELTDKTKDGPGTVQKFVTLVEPKTGETVGTAYRMEPGTFTEDPTRIGSIVFREAFGDDNDFVTDYRLYEVPDGLHITQYTRVDPHASLSQGELLETIKRTNARKGRYDGIRPPQTSEELMDDLKLRQFAFRAAQNIHAQIQSQVQDDEWGLSIVYEADARDLLTRLTPLRSEST
ncbi:MAG TPA: hypothetical protein VHB72_00140 [Candidatus Saccharimonadales bacterium]|nr:hypothetical protein [Candidatus Saccharimonadales bacterium]